MSDNPYKDQFSRFKQINKKLQDCQSLMEIMGTIYLEYDETEISDVLMQYFGTLGEFIIAWQSFLPVIQGFIKPSEIVVDSNITADSEVKTE